MVNENYSALAKHALTNLQKFVFENVSDSTNENDYPKPNVLEMLHKKRDKDLNITPDIHEIVAKFLYMLLLLFNT